MILQLDHGQPHPPRKQVPSPVVGAAQYRRLQRRAAERKSAAAEAVQEKTVVDVEAEQAKADEIVVDVDAEQARSASVNARPEDNVLFIKLMETKFPTIFT